MARHDDIRVLAFDIFGTVVDWHGSIVREVQALYPQVDADAFALAWRAGVFAGTNLKPAADIMSSLPPMTCCGFWQAATAAHSPRIANIEPNLNITSS